MEHYRYLRPKTQEEISKVMCPLTDFEIIELWCTWTTGSEIMTCCYNELKRRNSPEAQKIEATIWYYRLQQGTV